MEKEQSANETNGEEEIKSPFERLVILGDQVPIPNLIGGYIVVRKGFQICPGVTADVGFRHEKFHHRSDDFYSIPLIYSNISTEDPNHPQLIKRACEWVEAALERNNRKISDQGRARLFINYFDGETQTRDYFLYESKNGILETPVSYKVITDLEGFSKDANIPEILEERLRTEEYYEFIRDSSSRLHDILYATGNE